MKRRDLILLLCATALHPSIARGQSPKRLGILTPFPPGDAEVQAEVATFLQQLERLGWTAGQNLLVEQRWTPGRERTRVGVKELLALQPDAIFVRTTPATAALLKETRKVPLVFVAVSDPLGDGFVTSLARPGGNVTGFTNVESTMGGKWLELLKELEPGMTHAAVLYNPKTAPVGGAHYLEAVRQAAARLSVTMVPMVAETPAEIEAAIEGLARKRDAGLVVMADVTNVRHRAPIMAAVARHRLPAVYPIGTFAREGGLISYGVAISDLYRRAASYVDRILRGANPADLPIQSPAQFELIINLKTAAALGIGVPRSLVLRADRLIQ